MRLQRRQIMKTKNVFTLFAVLGILITLCIAQPQVQAAEAAQPVESNTTLTAQVVPLVRASGRSWTQLDPSENVTVAGVMPVTVSNIDGDKFTVNWAGIYVYGTRQSDDTWQVKYLDKTIIWDSFTNDLKLSGTFSYTFFPGTPSQQTQVFTGDLIIDSSANVLYTTWNFVPTGNATK